MKIIEKCKCGAYPVLTATGVRFEENGNAICKHTRKQCDWYTQRGLINELETQAETMAEALRRIRDETAGHCAYSETPNGPHCPLEDPCSYCVAFRALSN